jgi:hypothetical protein
VQKYDRRGIRHAASKIKRSMSLTFDDIFRDWKDHRFSPQAKSPHVLQQVKLCRR